MRRAVVTAAFALCAAGARSARADHGYGQQLDDVDDEPLAQELRAAFGGRISTCTHDGACALSLSELTCKGSVCRARDAAHGRKALVARGAAAKTVREHLHDLGSDHFVAGRAAAWEVRCAAQAEQGAKIRHGHCVVQLGDGDDALIDPIAGFGSNKLGGVWWTGDVIVECSDLMCHAQCAPGHLYLRYQDCEGAPVDFPREQGFAQALARRGGASAAVVSCGGWRDQSWDGGLVDVAGCNVATLPPATPVPRPWSALVRAGARWDLVGGGGDHLVIETNDVREVGAAQVARLRWRTAERDWADPSQGRPAQVAVTSAGIWFLDDGDDDAAIAHAIATTPPTYADTPGLTAPWAADFARVWHTSAGDAYCIGHDPQQVTCNEYTCSAVCFAGDAGVVLVGGDGGPGGAGDSYAQAGWTE